MLNQCSFLRTLVFTEGVFSSRKRCIICDTPGTEVKLGLLNTVIVILARGLNPSVLHPSFLLSEGIVPPDWRPSEPPVCTPKVSIIKYTNGISFLIDET